AALITGAEEALRLRRPAARRRHRLLIVAAVATLVGLAAALVATLVFRGLSDSRGPSDSALAVPVDKVNTLVRIDPGTNQAGGSIIRKRFPTSSRIDALTAGLGSVWVGSSSTATLYRIDPRSRRVTGSVDLGERAARPEVVLGSIWVGLADSGGDTVIVRPWG